VGSQCIYKWRRNQTNLLKEEAGKPAEEIDRRIIGNKEDKLMLKVQLHSLFLNLSTVLFSLNSLALFKQLHYLKPNFLFKSIFWC
jgi:hypothetical protein